MAQWVQSAALFGQNTLSMTMATTAIFEKKIAEAVANKDAETASALSTALGEFLKAAKGTDDIASGVGQTANQILNGFPPGPNSNNSNPFPESQK